jgi:hypothetical protein
MQENTELFFASPRYKSLRLSTKLRMQTLSHVRICECRRYARREGLVQRLLHRYHSSAWVALIAAFQFRRHEDKGSRRVFEGQCPYKLS